MGITLKKELIQQVINSLKSIDVRGYESMEKTVSLVMLFENILVQADEMMKKQQEAPKTEATMEEAE